MAMERRMQAALIEMQAARNVYEAAKERLLKAADTLARIQCEEEEATIMRGLHICGPTEVIDIPPVLVDAYDPKVRQVIVVDRVVWAHDAGEPFRRTGLIYPANTTPNSRLVAPTMEALVEMEGLLDGTGNA